MLGNSMYAAIGNRYFLIGLIVVMAGCVTIYNDATGRKERYFISEKTEVSVGQNMAGDIVHQNKTVNDPVLLTRLNRIGSKITQSSDRNELNYEFHILDEATMNAFALPGGYVFVNKGLMDRVNDDELAFVLAHEVGHIAARHSLKRLQTSLGMSLLMAIAFQDPDYDSVRQGLDVVYNVVALGYSRKDEYLADSLGLKYAQKAGFNPAGGVTLLEKLAAEGKRKSTPVFLSSHPPVEERITRIKEQIKKSAQNQ